VPQAAATHPLHCEQENKAMEILVIGGSGNISAAVVDRLLANGHQLTLFNRGTSSTPCTHVRGDRHDGAAFTRLMEGRRYDAVIDFLCYTPAHAAMAHTALRGRCGHYVFISSATVYRKPHRLPVREDDPKGNDQSEYATAKLACEHDLMALHGHDFPVSVVRPSHTFGETWIPSPISGCDFTVCARVLAGKPVVVHDDGRSLWALTAADDFARGLAGLIGNPLALGEDFHITTDEVLSWNGIYQEIGFALGRPIELVTMPSAFIAERHPDLGPKLLGDKAHHGCFDNCKIKAAVPSFACHSSLRQALRRSLTWFRADPARQTVDAEADRRQDELIAAWRQRT
jgi:nucleoside-diphosphate-sugar epimerase